MRKLFSIALPLALSAIASTACVVIDAPPRHAHHRHGPPPHAPAHGQRYKHHDHDLIFDGELGVYVVVGLRDVWFLDDHYFRISGDDWQVSVGTPDRWRVVAVSAVPVRLRAKHHPHGGPPGLAKKDKGKR